MSIDNAAHGGNPPSPRPIVHAGHDTPRPRLLMRVPEGGRSTTGRAADYVLGFGKHQGDALRDVPHAYLQWLAEKAYDPDARAAAAAYLRDGDGEEPDTDPEPSPALAAVVFPRLIWLWEQKMVRDWCLNPHAAPVIAAGLAELKRLSTTLTGKPWPADGEIGGAA